MNAYRLLLWLSAPELIFGVAVVVWYLVTLAIRGPQKGAQWIAVEPDALDATAPVQNVSGAVVEVPYV